MFKSIQRLLKLKPRAIAIIRLKVNEPVRAVEVADANEVIIAAAAKELS